VVEAGAFIHTCEGEIVCKLINEKVRYFCQAILPGIRAGVDKNQPQPSLLDGSLVTFGCLWLECAHKGMHSLLAVCGWSVLTKGCSHLLLVSHTFDKSQLARCHSKIEECLSDRL